MVNFDSFALRRPITCLLWHSIRENAPRADWYKLAQRYSLLSRRILLFLLLLLALLLLSPLFLGGCFALFFLLLLFLLVLSGRILLRISGLFSPLFMLSGERADVPVDEVFVGVDHGDRVRLEVGLGDAEDAGPHEIRPAEQERLHVLLDENVHHAVVGPGLAVDRLV